MEEERRRRETNKKKERKIKHDLVGILMKMNWVIHVYKVMGKWQFNIFVIFHFNHNFFLLIQYEHTATVDDHLVKHFFMIDVKS